MYVDIGTNRKRTDGNIYPSIHSEPNKEPQKQRFINSETDYMVCVFEEDITESNSGLVSDVISQEQIAWNK